MTNKEIGMQMPEFKGIDQDGNAISSEDYKGKKLIVFFYPKASTPGCTAESCNFRDFNTQWQEKGYSIIGISADSEKRQKNFAEKNQLPYVLIADESKEILNAFGVWGLKKNYGREYEGIFRTTFVMDKNHKIIHLVKKVKTKEASEQLFKEMDI
ncbi:MAG: thioredoxin-dependent thiol peroxidase [Bacteroidetes bacterium 4572_77]|nr:MAG: thioredoxin-dependent thiol peroxidase [Bacteroidetes bacterium 4572_77]